MNAVKSSSGSIWQRQNCQEQQFQVRLSYIWAINDSMGFILSDCLIYIT